MAVLGSREVSSLTMVRNEAWVGMESLFMPTAVIVRSNMLGVGGRSKGVGGGGVIVLALSLSGGGVVGSMRA